MEVAIIGAILSAVGFGLANIVIKKALSDTSIPQTLISSMVSGAVFLLVLVLFRGFPSEISSQLIITLALFAIGEVTLYLSLYKAFDAADVSVASGILSVYPIISTLYAVVFLEEQVSSSKVFFIFLLVIGAIIIGLDWNNLKTKKLGLKSFEKGLPWAIFSLFVHAIYFPALGNLTSTGEWEFKLLGIKVFAVIILLIIFLIIRKSEFKLTKDRIIAGTILGFLEIVGWIGLSYASSNSAGMIAIIVALGSSAPLVTSIVAKFYLKEKLNFMQYVGILIVVVGLTLIALV